MAAWTLLVCVEDCITLATATIIIFIIIYHRHHRYHRRCNSRECNPHRHYHHHGLLLQFVLPLPSSFLTPYPRTLNSYPCFQFCLHLPIFLPSSISVVRFFLTLSPFFLACFLISLLCFPSFFLVSYFITSFPLLLLYSFSSLCFSFLYFVPYVLLLLIGFLLRLLAG